jgi:hypothetical protein
LREEQQLRDSVSRLLNSPGSDSTTATPSIGLMTDAGAGTAWRWYRQIGAAGFVGFCG